MESIRHITSSTCIAYPRIGLLELSLQIAHCDLLVLQCRKLVAAARKQGVMSPMIHQSLINQSMHDLTSA